MVQPVPYPTADPACHWTLGQYEGRIGERRGFDFATEEFEQEAAEKAEEEDAVTFPGS